MPYHRRSSVRHRPVTTMTTGTTAPRPPPAPSATRKRMSPAKSSNGNSALRVLMVMADYDSVAKQCDVKNVPFYSK